MVMVMLFLFMCSDIIATGCSDKCVRVYYLATSIDKELKKFTGNIFCDDLNHSFAYLFNAM